MNKIYTKARAKINLNLLILNKREDNYHNLKSVFQKVNLYDELYINKIDEDQFILETNVESLNNKENIIYKVYEKLKELYGSKINCGIRVLLKKNIPMQAGMAGGSTDGASFILAMNKLFKLNMEKKEVENISKEIGADVVPCLYNKALLAEGIGNIVTPLNTNLKYYIVVIKPELNCDTKEMFQKIDSEEGIKQKDKTNEIVEALQNGNIEDLRDNMYNAFEDVIIEKNDIIRIIKQELLSLDAVQSMMTGSGSCVFGIFKNKEIAKRAYNKLKEKYKTYICISYNSKKDYM